MRRARDATGHVAVRAVGVVAAVGMFLALTALPAYAVVPTITQVWPTTANSAVTPCQVTITGTNFLINGGPATTVSFGGTLGTIVSVDADTQLEAVLPTLGAGTSANVIVHNSSGDSLPFTFTTGPAGTCPGVPSFSPASGPVGTTVTITGSFTTAPTTVRFGTGSLVVPSTSSPTSATVTVPAGTTSGPIHVYTTAGQATSLTSFTVASAVPTITSFTPTSGPVGTSVVITGTNFTGATSVTFNTTTATTFTVNSATQITATVPTGATTGPIKVTTPGGTATSTTNFTVTGLTKSRTVSFQLSGHLRASGNVSSSDNNCVKFVPVKVQRQRAGGNWKTLELLSTGSGGSFSGFLPNRSGRYRASVAKMTLLNGTVCGADTSPSRKHVR